MEKGKMEEEEKGLIKKLGGEKMKSQTKGVLVGLGILLVMLMVATGSASAAHACVADDGSGDAYFCGDLVNKSCTLNGTMTCPANGPNNGIGLEVNAGDITIDGASAGHTINGSSPGTCSDLVPRAGIHNPGNDNVTIKNLKVKNFCIGIFLYGEGNQVDDNTVDNCEIHDNGNASSGIRTQGIYVYCANESKMTNNTIYNNSGAATGGCDHGGSGIYLFGCECGAGGKGHHEVKNNTIYNNSRAGIYSKLGVKHCNVTYNKVYENGEEVASTYFGGGIRLECIHTNNWTVSYNTVTDNYGPGIFVRGDYNNITHNDVTNNKNASSVATGVDVGVGYGIFIHSQGNHNNITYNRVCNNNGTDIYNNSDATNTFDENICNTSHPDGLCEYPCVYAYKYQIDNSPGVNDPNEEFNTTEYANARVDDDVRACNKTTLDERYAAHRFNFTVREPTAKIDKIKVIWNGIGKHDSLTDGAKLYIWKDGTGYELLQASANVETEVTLTGEVTSSISNYINSNNVTILVNQTSAQTTDRVTDYSHIKTDLAKIVIYFKYP